MNGPHANPMYHSILITGGAGFIGSHLTKRFVRLYPETQIIVLDLLTYAGHRRNLAEVEALPNFRFEHGDISDPQTVRKVFSTHRVDAVIHLAAETHVDRSIESPAKFLTTNVLGTSCLLEVAKESWQEVGGPFCHISTDEVFGSLGPEGSFTENSPYAPRSPYAASKAAGDHLVRSYHTTYGLPIKIVHCSNNYGPFQFPEKLIPLCLHRILHQEPIPIYGTGENVRDWLYVEDHCEAIDLIFMQGRVGESYGVGGDSEQTNLTLVKELCRLADEKLGRPEGTSNQLIRFVSDRPGHDFRYSIDSSKLRQELGWKPRTELESGLRATVSWYLDNRRWIDEVMHSAATKEGTQA